MENSIFMVILFPDNHVEAILKMQAVMQFIDELGGLIIDPDEETDGSFLAITACRFNDTD